MEKWIYQINKKFKAALLLAIVLGTILLTNIFEKSTVTDLDKSFSSMYEDRLLPATYIFNITDHLYRKRLLWEDADNIAANRDELLHSHNLAIDSLLADFEKTFLVEKEKSRLKEFRRDLYSYNINEAAFVSGSPVPHDKEKLNADLDGLMSHLNMLSNIQVETAKEMRHESRASIDTSIMLSHFEIAMLIVVGTMINMLILSSRSITNAMKKGALDHWKN